MAKLNLFCTRCGEQANPVPSLRARKQTLAQFKALFYPNGVCRDCVLKERSAQDAELLLTKLRERGYAVRAFSPAELNGADPINVEAAMGAAGSSSIEHERFYQPDPLQVSLYELPLRSHEDRIVEQAKAIVDNTMRCIGDRFDGLFYSPEEWQQRGELYGEGAVLIVTHDGGAAAFAFDMRSPVYVEMQKELEKIGLFMDSLTCWATGIFRI